MKKLAMGLVVALGLFVGAVAFSMPARAEVPNPNQAAFSVAKKSAACYVLAKTKGAPDEVLKVYGERVGEFAMHPDIIYHMGWVEGNLHSMSARMSNQMGIPFYEALLKLSTALYQDMNCTTAQSM